MGCGGFVVLGHHTHVPRFGTVFSSSSQPSVAPHCMRPCTILGMLELETLWSSASDRVVFHHEVGRTVGLLWSPD